MLNKSGGNFWIQVNGISDSFKIAASGYLPRTDKLGGCILIFGLLLGMTLAIHTKDKIEHCLSNVATATLNSSLVSLVFLMLVALIDLWSPISTKRNYIVLLPFLGIIIAGAITLLTHQSPAYSKKILGVFVVFFSISLCASFDTVYRKSHTGQDWRGASLYLIRHHGNKSLYYISESEKEFGRHLNANFYIKKFSNGSLEAIPYVVDKTILVRPAAILSGHHKNRDAIKREMTEIGAKLSYNAKSSIEIENVVGVYVLQ
jgi:hypothetical protein